MRPKNAIRAFALLAIFLASNIGCIGLVPAREFMEDVRDPPQLEEVIEKINVNHTFVSINFQPVTFQERFVIDENVQELKVYIGVAFAGPDAVSVGALRYVEASITDSNGERIWEERCEDTCRPSVSTFQQPLAMGTWTLSIEAQAHGEELFGNLQDTFDVYVHIHRECWQYPTESECTYD